MKKINPSKKNGYGFKERIKNASSIKEIDTTLYDALDPDTLALHLIDMETSHKIISKLKALANRKKKALTKN
jgi:hypothetical protein